MSPSRGVSSMGIISMLVVDFGQFRFAYYNTTSAMFLTQKMKHIPSNGRNFRL